jgi:hypothetical protein
VRSVTEAELRLLHSCRAAYRPSMAAPEQSRANEESRGFVLRRLSARDDRLQEDRVLVLNERHQVHVVRRTTKLRRSG